MYPAAAAAAAGRYRLPSAAILNEEERERLQIIKATYERALARGDGHVYFVDGSRLLRRFGGDSKKRGSLKDGKKAQTGHH